MSAMYGQDKSQTAMKLVDQMKKSGVINLDITVEQMARAIEGIKVPDGAPEGGGTNLSLLMITRYVLVTD